MVKAKPTIPKSKNKPALKKPAPQSKYDPRYCPRFIGWLAREGKTHDEIAEEIGVGRDTLYRWKREFPDVDKALRENRKIADYQVEEAAFKRATGYDYNKVEIEVSEVGDKVFKKKKETVMHVPADPTTLIFWLANRKPDKWKRNPQFVDFEKSKGEILELFDQMKKST